MIRFENVTKEFPSGKTAVQELSFNVEPGEFLYISGPSGAGKTTVLRLLLRELEPSSGKIFIKDEDITDMKQKQLPLHRRRIGAIFQDYKLIEDRTISENVGLISEMIKESADEVKVHVENILKTVGLEDKLDMFPSQLSGGELQRTAIARALATEPEIIFADEPTGNLDQTTSWEIINLLLDINKKGTTVIVATHNQEILNTLKKRIIELKEGRVVKDTKKAKKKDKNTDKNKAEQIKEDSKPETEKDIKINEEEKETDQREKKKPA